MLCLPNVAITDCWITFIEVFLRQCVHVLFENEMLLHIEDMQCFVWVLAIRSLYFIVAELNLHRANTDPTDTIHRLILKGFKTTFPSTACLLKKLFYKKMFSLPNTTVTIKYFSLKSICTKPNRWDASHVNIIKNKSTWQMVGNKLITVIV